MEHTGSQTAVSHSSLTNILSLEMKQFFLGLKDSSINNLHIIIYWGENIVCNFSFTHEEWGTVPSCSIIHVSKIWMVLFTVVLHSNALILLMFLNWLPQPWIQVGQLPLESNFYYFKSPNYENKTNKQKKKNKPKPKQQNNKQLSLSVLYKYNISSVSFPLKIINVL